ncbi:3-hydroxybenzoate 6-hydroxylase [Fusarium mexicanum]|uniref:3-hydroxybenzoate 6-hydroxylase n=1 Tax=Fusarium mexicanum TaxID=751941 RepID=A0A8H5MQC2_9HYPO|nr:3-hydroxybenzoate 6-hydroxylase [Fusarium mexicanum]
MTLKVGIIGAGIGGLSAALALRRTGAQVEVFEKSNFKDEIGAAITITPNGMRVFSTSASIPRQRGVCRISRCVEDDYGTPFMFFHHVDLHTALKEMAVSSDERYPGDPVVIHNGHSVTSLDYEKATIVLDNGKTFVKDLVVVADGIRTKLIGEITQKDVPLEGIGSSFYRCLIPFSKVNKNPDLEAIFKNQDPGFWVPFDLSTGTFLVTYPCRDGKMLNVAFRHKTKAENEHAVDWNTDTNVQDITAMVGGFNPLVAKLFSLSTSVSVHKLFRREPLERYTRGRAVIIGDAAHLIQPTHAQGAVLAIEEAAALEALFKDVQRPEKVTERLGLYNDILKRRIHVTQLLSDAQPGISSILRQRAEDIWGEGIFPPEAMNFTKPIRDFFYAWDVMEEAEKVLASTYRSWVGEDIYKPTFISHLDLKDIALDLVRGHFPDISEAFFEDEAEETLKLEGLAMVIHHHSLAIRVPGHKVILDVFADVKADPFEVSGTRLERKSRVERYTNFYESFERAKEWISECLTTHPCPRPGTSKVMLPKRVLVVKGAPDDPVRLIEARGDEYPYVCLSHRWGNPTHKQLKTTTRTLNSHMSKIEWESLPATFKDASFAEITPSELEATRHNFALKNSNIARTYQNSHFTISADLSDHMDSGFFSRDPVHEYSKDVTTNKGRVASVYIRRPIDHYREDIPNLETRS